MRWVDFLMAVLEAYGQTLKDLEVVFGVEGLMELLETTDDQETGWNASPQLLKLADEVSRLLEGASARQVSDGLERSPYVELEGCVQALGLHPVLEFYVWSFPIYRYWVEQHLPLEVRFERPGTEVAYALVEEVVAEAERWIERIGVPKPLRTTTQKITRVPWVRFRTDTLKRIGRRPLGPVY